MQGSKLHKERLEQCGKSCGWMDMTERFYVLVNHLAWRALCHAMPCHAERIIAFRAIDCSDNLESAEVVSTFREKTVMRVEKFLRYLWLKEQ